VGSRDAGPGSPYKAVALGLAVDVGGSTVAGVALSLLYSIILAATGTSAKEIAELVTHPAHDSWYYILGLVTGTALSVLGGYVCARIAKRSEVKLGAIMAALSTLVGGVLTQLEDPDMTLVTVIVTFGAVMSGALMGRAGNRGRSAPA